MNQIQENSRRLRDEVFPAVESNFIEYRDVVRQASLQQEAKIEQRLQELAHRIGQQTSMLQLEESALSALQEENRQLEALIDVDKQVLEAQRKVRAPRRKAENSKSEDLKTQELLAGDLRRAVSNYERCLAFSMKRLQDSGLRIAFTHVCRGREDVEHSCVIYVRNDLYEAEACSPPIDSLHALVAQLNASNNFSGFVKQLRREFCRLYI